MRRVRITAVRAVVQEAIIRPYVEHHYVPEYNTPSEKGVVNQLMRDLEPVCKELQAILQKPNSNLR